MPNPAKGIDFDEESKAPGLSFGRSAQPPAKAESIPSSQPLMFLEEKKAVPAKARENEKEAKQKKVEAKPSAEDSLTLSALSTRSLEEIFEKWRSSLGSLAKDYKETADGLKQQELQLYDSINKVGNLFFVADNISKKYSAYRGQLDAISNEQDSLNATLSKLDQELDRYLGPEERQGVGLGQSAHATREQVIDTIQKLNAEMDKCETEIEEIRKKLNAKEGGDKKKDDEESEKVLNLFGSIPLYGREYR